MSKALQVGDKAPDFQLQGDDGQTHSLKDYLGKYVILYFYPKDMTPGCTTEACEFNDHLREYEKYNAVVFGVSKDGIESHLKFKAKHNLGFVLLSDPDVAMHKAYGAYTEKGLWGKLGPGVLRSTFLIDPKGHVAHVWPNVKVSGHVEEVLLTLKKQGQ